LSLDFVLIAVWHRFLRAGFDVVDADLEALENPTSMLREKALRAEKIVVSSEHNC
jgi:hypothetical protein